MEEGYSKIPGARCWECPFKNLNPVPTWNPQPKSKIVIMGEAPGAHEHARGIPFTGPSGRLLDQVLEHHEIRRDEVMITNACLCVKGDTKVRMANGTLRRINDLVANRSTEKVMSYKDGYLVPARITGWYKNKLNNRRLLRISHQYAKENSRGTVGFTVTEDHPVLTGFGYTRADELIVGRSTINTGLPDFGCKHKQLIYSGILGDATVSKKYATITFMNSTKQLDYINAKAKLFGVKTSLRLDNNMLYFSTPAMRALLPITELSKIDIVHRLTKFGLACWFFDDGYTRFRDQRRPRCEISITSWSIEEAETAARIISDRFAKCYVYKSNAGPRLQFGVDGAEQLLNIIGEFVTPSVLYKINAPESNRFGTGCDDWGTEKYGIFYDIVSSIEEVRQQGDAVYCIDVEETHNFVVVGGVLHNCRPTDNADPPKGALEACAPRLHAEIAASGATRIIALGKVASHAVLAEKSSMKKLRVGPAKPYRINQDIKVIATWHPAYCLRVPDAFPDLVNDFSKVQGEQKYDWTDPVYRVFDDPSSAIRALQQLRTRFNRVVVDIECGVEKDHAFVHPSEYDLLCVGFSFAPGRAVVIGENALKEREVHDELRRVLSSVRIIAHNGKFDLAGLRTICGKQEIWFDTMLASYCLDARAGYHGLKTLSIEQLGAPDYEASIKQYIPRGGNYAHIPRDVLYRYNAYDVVCTWRLYELFTSEMSDTDKRKMEFIVRAANALIELELNGIGFDLVYNKQLATDYLAELGDLETRIKDVVGYELNPRSPQQITAYYAKQGYTLNTTNADLLKELIEFFDGETAKFTELLLQHRKEAKKYGTYVKGLAKRVSHGKIFTTYLLHGTTSGRLASREPNLQNVDRDKKIRNQFVVEREGNYFIQCDYKQAEGRVIATLSQEEYLRSIFADQERDLFNELCNDIFGVGKWNKENRVSMKSIFYGNAYGRGVSSITRELQLQGSNITNEEVATLMREFNALIPNVLKWQASIKHDVMSGKDLETPYGRRRSFWLITDQNRADVLNEALSFLPQSIASDICLTALLRLQPMLEGIAIPRLTIHDAIVVETNSERVDETIVLMKEEMTRAAAEFTIYVPFTVDATVATRLGEL